MGRLDDHRATRRDRRRDLARAHRHGKIPRRHEHARTHRLAHGEDPPRAGGVDHVAPVYAHGLLGEPAEELGRVGDLRARLRQRLAHLKRHHQSQLLRARDDRLVGAPQDLPTLARGGRAPPRLRLRRRGERLERVLGARVGHLGELLAGRRVLHAERRPAGRLAPAPSHVQLPRQPLHHRPLLGWAVRHHGTRPACALRAHLELAASKRAPARSCVCAALVARRRTIGRVSVRALMSTAVRSDRRDRGATALGDLPVLLSAPGHGCSSSDQPITAFAAAWQRSPWR